MARKTRKPMSDINVVPYIDVMLVLLIIFMVTAPMLTQGVKVDLPKIESDPVQLESDQEPLIVTVDSNGAYYIEIGDQTGKPMERSVLATQAEKILQQTPGKTVLVRGDRNAPYGLVIDLMAVLKDAGADSVGLITENP